MDAQAAMALTELAQEMLHDEEATWSVGTFGALAEFQSVRGDPPASISSAPGGGSLITDRGALHVHLAGEERVIAYEGLGDRPSAWTQKLVFCLPADDATIGDRSRLTELGPDTEAIRRQDREAILFDLGLGVPYIAFCVRTADPELVALLRAAEGAAVLAADAPVTAAIKKASPHRVCFSRIARIEVYQPIASPRLGIATPLGPHTHLLPDLVEERRMKVAEAPLPPGWLPLLTLYPGNPVIDRVGRVRPFDAALHKAFQQLLERYAPPGYMEEKLLISAAVLSGMQPSSYAIGDARDLPLSARVALRQLLHTCPEAPGITAWLQAFDGPSAASHPREG
jgi:hypothetical protein